MKIFLAGDSTVASCPPHEAPMAGWGQVAAKFFNENITIVNAAKGGRSSNSFIEEGLLDGIWEAIAPGDYLFIQFGHNDQKEFGTKPWTTFPHYLTQYIDGARERGAIPVLVTSVQRRTFGEDGMIHSSLGEYPDSMRKLADEKDVPLIDLHEKTKTLYESYGPDRSTELFTWLAPGENGNYPDGVQDNTHFCETGARAVASLVVEGIKELNLPLKAYIKKPAGKLYHGACFYPELWDEKTVAEDIEWMKKTGINVVRIGEFAWSKLEPEEGRIDVSFLVDMIKRLHENGIETVLCTPTPTPPIWFSHGHPERMHVDQEGRVMNHGSRQHACTNNAYFRGKAAQITEELAKKAGQLPGLIAWQLDNEFKCHIAECMCSTCKGLWHEWLEDRYGTIDRLNEEWGTHIWSEYYQSFEQVPQPVATPFLHHSSLQTMYRLFSTEKIAEFADEQAAIIRRYSDLPITHNSTLMFSVDNERLFQHLDFASFDTYAPQGKLESYVLNCDIWRNIKKNTPYWVMETSTSHAASLESYAHPHANGYLQTEAVAAYALGGQGFCYWLWRQQRTGSEQPHSAVMSAWGEPSVGYENVLQVEEARKEIEPLMLATKPVQAQVAMTYSDKARMFHQTEPHNGIRYKDMMTDLYNVLLTEGLHRDVIFEGAELDGYKLLFTPLLPHVSEDYLSRAKAFVESGGIWIVGPMTGGRTGEHTIHTSCALGEVEKWTGVKTLFTFPMDEQTTTGEAFGETAPLGLWSAVFDSEAAVGTIKSGVATGKAFLTETAIGKGKVVMLGSMPMGDDGNKLLKRMIRHYAEEAGVTVKTDASPGTIVAPRMREDGKEVWIVVNMDGKGGTVTIPSKGSITVEPHGYSIQQVTKEEVHS